MADVREFVPPVVRRFTSPHGPVRTHILSNGRYAVMLTAAGSGYSRWGDIAVTRWREDVTRDEAGMHVYLRDAQSGQSWSVGYQPTGDEPESYEVVFSEDRAKIARRDGAIATTLDPIADQAQKYPGQLSGGQQQRVAIARALMMRPKIMLFDEPTSALDPEMINEVLDVMIELADEGMTMLVVTHEMAFARAAASRVWVFDEGRLVEDGPPAQVCDSPRSECARAFFAHG